MGRLRRAFILMLFLGAAVFVTWRIADDSDARDAHITSAFQDADRRLHAELDGRNNAGLSFEVPRGLSVLRVGVCYDVDGDIGINLHGPDGVNAYESIDGDTHFHKNDWWRIGRPPAGDWQLSINGKADGLFTVGIYFE